MKIAILNRVFLTQKHIDRLKTLGEVVFHTDTDNEQKAIEHLNDTDIAIVDGFICPLNANVLNNTNNLKYIVIQSTGYDCIDLETATQKGIKVSNVPTYASRSVAELAIALMFAVARKIPLADKAMRNDFFEIDPRYDLYNQFVGSTIKGKTMGILGHGEIGSKVAEMAKGLGMQVLCFTKHPAEINWIKFLSLQEVLTQSDVVSIHLPLTPETENIISTNEFKQMKTESILINTARGKHVNTQALYKALKTGEIGGAGVDVIADADENHPIFKLENIVFTPHLAFFTDESLRNLADTVVANVEAYIKGSPINLVN